MDADSVPATILTKLLKAKDESGKSHTQIAEETGLTNVHVAQLFKRQAQLKPETVPALKNSLPFLTDDVVLAMMKLPFRSYKPNLLQEPAVYRLNEAVMHFGESIKEIINEDFGDGIVNHKFLLLHRQGSRN